MVVQIRAKARDREEWTVGHGLLFYAYENIDKIPHRKWTWPPSKSEVSTPKPFIATLWHVIGIDANSDRTLVDCEFTMTDGSNHDLKEVLCRRPLRDIDKNLADQIGANNDGMCLLRPACGCSPKKSILSQLAIPELNPDPIVAEALDVCILANHAVGGALTNFPIALGPALKRGGYDSYVHGGPSGLLGNGTSGGVVTPSRQSSDPPPIVYGFHCGSYWTMNPPTPYLFLGNRAIQDMLEELGYFHPVYDQSRASSGLFHRLLHWFIPA